MYPSHFFLLAIERNVHKKYYDAIILYEQGLKSFRIGIKHDKNIRRRAFRLAEYRKAKARYDSLVAKLKYMSVPTIFE